MTNLLPKDGTAIYIASAILEDESKRMFDTLLNEIEWRADVVTIFGKTYTTARKVAWYGDNNFAYTYSNATKIALPWTPTLMQIKTTVENHCKFAFNSCLLNLYHHGDEGMGWHSDDEKTLGSNPVIASVSLGAARKFSFKHKHSDEKISVLLENGSILLMKDETQHFWLHSLPKTKRVHAPRINLTFRKFLT